MGKYVAIAALILASPPSIATTCLMPTARQDFAASDVVVAAEAHGVSVKPHPVERGKFRQTVRWRVHESWKGGHSYGKDFTTRTTMDCPTCAMYEIRPGRLMVLYLTGAEPYPILWCGKTNLLEHSLKDIPLLYRLSGAQHGT